jgi:hypothetical protein
VISGKAHVNFTQTASTGTWTGSPTSYAYAWFRCDATGKACTAIAGATGASYKPVAGDAGSTLRVSVSATNAYGTGTAQSAPTFVLRGGGGSGSSP